MLPGRIHQRVVTKWHRVHVGELADTGQLPYQVDVPQICMQSEIHSLGEGPFIKNKRNIFRGCAQSRVIRSKRDSQPLQIVGCALIADIKVPGELDHASGDHCKAADDYKTDSSVGENFEGRRKALHRLRSAAARCSSSTNSNAASMRWILSVV